MQLFVVDATGKHGDGAARKGGEVSCGIDAAGESGGDDKAFVPEIGRKCSRQDADHGSDAPTP